MAVLKTQGSDLYFIDPATNEAVLVECITSAEGITSAREQVEVTCLSDSDRQYIAGLGAPGTATFGLNFNPTAPSHIRLHEIYRAGTSVQWALALSDGTAPPTADTAGDFVFPATRSFLTFAGYVSEFPFNLALNTVVQSNLAIQISGAPDLIAKTAP